MRSPNEEPQLSSEKPILRSALEPTLGLRNAEVLGLVLKLRVAYEEAEKKLTTLGDPRR